MAQIDLDNLRSVQELAQTAVAAGKLATEFYSALTLLENQRDNDDLKDAEAYANDEHLMANAYMMTIYYESNQEVKLKTILLLGLVRAEWLPEVDKELVNVYL